MSSTDLRSSRSALSDRSSVSNAAIPSSSLPSTTFAPPTIHRLHPLHHPIAKADAPPLFHSTAGGKENAGEPSSSPPSSSTDPSLAKVALRHEAEPHSPLSPSGGGEAARPSLSSSFPSDSARLSFARPAERVLRIHSIDDRESLARLSVGPSTSSAPAPSFRYSLRSSYRPYQWTANGGAAAPTVRASTAHSAAPRLSSPPPASEEGPLPPSRPSTALAAETVTAVALTIAPSPPRQSSASLRTPDRGSLHRRQLSARKQSEGGREAPSLSTPSQSSPASHGVHHISRTPLLLSVVPSSSYATLPYYRPPSSSSSSPQRSAKSWTSPQAVAEVKEDGGGWERTKMAGDLSAAFASSSPASLPSSAASEADPSFRAFVSSQLYFHYETEGRNNEPSPQP